MGEENWVRSKRAMGMEPGERFEGINRDEHLNQDQQELRVKERIKRVLKGEINLSKKELIELRDEYQKPRNRRSTGLTARLFSYDPLLRQLNKLIDKKL